MQRLNAIPTGYVQTPHGLVDERCVHEIAEGDSIPQQCQFPPTELRTLLPRGPGGWIESAFFVSYLPLGSMRVKFEVPQPPSTNGALIYLFPGAEDSQMSTILQPVLQWGDNGHFGGEQWTIASWHCTPVGVTLHSPPVSVSPGDVIVGTVKVTSHTSGACDWLIETSVDSDPAKSTSLAVPGVDRLLLFLTAGVLEGYELEDSSRYPASGSTTFTIDELTDLNGLPMRLNWNTKSPATPGFSVGVSINRTAVTLQYPH